MESMKDIKQILKLLNVTWEKKQLPEPRILFF